MRRNRVGLLAIASAGLLLSAGAFAEDPPFQNSPGAPKPADPPSPPAFTEEGSDPAAPKPTVFAPPASAPPAPIGTPDFGGQTSPATPSAPASSVAAGPVMPSLKPIDSSPAPVRSAPAPRSVRPAPKRPAATEQPAPRRKINKKRGGRAESLGPVATFPAFRMMEGGSSRVFVKISGKVEITEHKAQGQIVYRMRGVDVPSRTNRLPLDTSFFATPIGQVRLVRQGGDADLVIELRQPSEAQHRLEEQRDGVVLVVDFPRLTGSLPPSASVVGGEPERAARAMSTSTTRIGSGSGPDF